MRGVRRDVHAYAGRWALPLERLPPARAPKAEGVSRENADQKGARYLTEGRLRVIQVDEDDGVVMAECRGDGRLYALGFDERGWFCSCPAYGRCAHLKALGRVVIVQPRRTP